MLQNQTLIEIINNGKQYEAIQMLLHSMHREKEIAKSENDELKANLRIIKKINKGKSKEIDSLCEQDIELKKHREKTLRSKY